MPSYQVTHIFCFFAGRNDGIRRRGILWCIYSSVCLLKNWRWMQGNTFKKQTSAQKPSLSNSRFGFQVVILQNCSKWTVLSGQLFLQLLFIPLLHFYPFLFIPVSWFIFLFLLFIPLFPFRDPITSQTEHFWVDFFAQKTFRFKFPIWVPSRDPPKMFKMNSFKWTVVFAIALHSSTDQSKGLLFSLLDLTNLTP